MRESRAAKIPGIPAGVNDPAATSIGLGEAPPGEIRRRATSAFSNLTEVMRAFVCLVMLLLASVEVGSAQWRTPRRDRGGGFERRGAVEFGVRGGYDFDAEAGSAGAQLRIPLIRQLLVVPSGDVYFVDENEGADWQLNADLVAKPDELGGLYLGIGAAFMQLDLDGDDDEEVEAGYNLFAGIDGGSLLRTRLRPFAEARWSFVNEVEPFRLVAGINAPVQ